MSAMDSIWAEIEQANNTGRALGFEKITELLERASGASAEGTKLTMFYSGNFSPNGLAAPKGLNSGDLVKPVVDASNGEISRIRLTEVGQMVDDERFKEQFNITMRSLGIDPRAVDIPESEANRYMNGGIDPATGIYKEGVWNIASKVFARDTTGAVWAVVPFADPDRIWLRTEIHELFSVGNQVTSINGMSKAALKALATDSDGVLNFGKIVDAIQKSSQEEIAKISYGMEGGKISYVDTGDLLHSYGLSDQHDIRANISALRDIVAMGIEKPNSLLMELDESHLKFMSTDMAKVLAASFKQGKLGTLFILGTLGLASKEAHSAVLDGDTQKASKVMAEWVAEAVGMIIAGGLFVAGTTVAVPAAAVGTLAAAITIFAGGVAGGFLGASAGEELFALSGEIGISIGNVLADYNETAYNAYEGVKSFFSAIYDFFDSPDPTTPIAQKPAYINTQSKTVSVNSVDANGVKTTFTLYKLDGSYSASTDDNNGLCCINICKYLILKDIQVF